MADEDVDILGRIIVDSSDADEKMDSFSKQTDAVGEGMNQLGMIGSFVWGQLIVKGIEAAVEAIQNIAKEVSAFVQDVINEAADEEAVIAQLDNAVANLGPDAAMTTDEMIGLAEALGQTTALGHDAALAGENLLIRFTNIGHNVFPQVTQAAADLASATGVGLSGAMRMLGRSLEDPSAGMAMLRRYNIILDDTVKLHIKTLQTTAESYEAQSKVQEKLGNHMAALALHTKYLTGMEAAQAVILGEVEKAYGGAAEAAGKTYKGQLAILGDTFSEIKETLGTAFLPLLTTVVGLFQSFASDSRVRMFFENISTAISNLLQPIIDLIGDFTNLNTAGSKIKEDLGKLFPEEMVSKVWNLIDTIKQLFDMVSIGFTSGGLSGAFDALLKGLPDIGGILGSIFKTIDWSKIFSNIATAGSGLSAKFLAMIQSIDWAGLSDDIIAWIKGIDWSNLGTQFAITITNLWKVVDTILSGIKWGEIFGATATAFADFVVGMMVPGGTWKTDVAAVWKADFKEIGKFLDLEKESLSKPDPKFSAALVTAFTSPIASIKSVWNTQIENWKQLIGIIKKLWIAFGDWVFKIWEDAKKTWTDNWKQFVHICVAIVDDVKKAAADIINGLLDGLKGAWADVVSWWTGSVKHLIDLFNLLIGRHSPSSVFADIGKDIMAGLAQGINASITVPVTAMAGFVPAATGAISSVGGSGGGVRNITFNISGAGDPKAVANEITHLLKLNGIQTL